MVTKTQTAAISMALSCFEFFCWYVAFAKVTTLTVASASSLGCNDSHFPKYVVA